MLQTFHVAEIFLLYSFFSLKKNYLNESYNLQIFQLKRILQHTRLKEKGDGRKKEQKIIS